MTTTESDSGEEPTLDSTQLALVRTWLAHERTLMAWVRTATSLIAFGFTIYKFFQLEIEAVHKWSNVGLITPRDFALMMISIGLLTLSIATVTRRKEIKNISIQLKRGRFSPAELLAGVVLVFGVLVLLATAMRI